MDNLQFQIDIIGASEELRELGRLENALKDLAAQKKELAAQFKFGQLTAGEYNKELGRVSVQTKALADEKRVLEKQIHAEATAFKGAEGSMVRLNQELGNLRERYRGLSEAERENTQVGGALLTEISALDTKLKSLDAGIGNHQRSVGNYKMVLEGLNLKMTEARGRFDSLEKSMSQVDKTTKEGKQSWDVLQKELEQTKQEIKSLEVEQRKLTDSSQQQGKALGNLGSTIKSLPANFMALSVAVTGVIAAAGGFISFMKDSIQLSLEQERADKKLLTALGQRQDAYERMKRLQENLEKTTVFSQEEIRNAINLSLALGRTEAETRKLIPAALALSNATGMEMDGAIKNLNKTFGGLTGELGETIPELKNLTKAQLEAGDAVDFVNQKFGKFLSEGMNTMQGNITQAKKNWDEFKESIGKGTSEIFNFFYENIQRLGGLKNIFNPTGTLAYLQEEAKKFDYVEVGRKQIQQAEDEIAATRNSYAQRAATQRLAIEKAGEENRKKNIELGKKQAEQDAKDSESMAAKLSAIAIKNQDYILTLSQKYVDAQLSIMVAGVEKQLALEEEKYNRLQLQLQKENEARVAAIEKQVQEVEARGSKATKDELDMAARLLEEKQLIIDAGNRLQEQEAESHQNNLSMILRAATEKDLKTYMEGLDKKSEAYLKAEQEFSRRGTKGDSAAVTAYNEGVALAEAEMQEKLRLLHDFYATKGPLTKQQEGELANEEKKLTLEVFQQKFNLLQAEIKARKELGTVSEEELQSQQNRLSELYQQVRDMTDEMEEDSEADGENSFGGKIINFLFGGLKDALEVSDEEWGRWSSDMVAQATELLSTIQNAIIQNQTQRINQELSAEKKKLNDQKTQELKALEERRKRGLINEEQYSAAKALIEENYQKKAEAEERKAFEKKKKLAIAMIWINAAMAVIKSIAEYGPILGGILGALVIITAAIETDTVNKQQYAKGGIVNGPSHAQGGVKFETGGTVSELEGGEAVINKRAVASSDILNMAGTPKEIMSSINSMYGGKKFADGGVINPSNYSPSPIQVRTPSVNVSNQIDYDLLAEKLGGKIAASVNDKTVNLSMVELQQKDAELKAIDDGSRW